MTSPEAACLVLKAASIARGGELFVLDMGQPVKIRELAERMIQLYAPHDGRKVEIVYVGLRPGEKLYEELLLAGEGIAKTVKALCDAVGLPCIVALSEAAPEIGVRYRHTWNVVTVEGQRYHVDATFDNSLQRGMKRYDYFNLDDRHIFRDHQRLVLPLPECSGDKGYFYRSLSFTKTEDVEKRVRQALRKKQEHFVFHWRGGGLNQEILGQLLEKCAGAAAERGKTVGCSLNRAQAVIQMDFSDAPAGEVLVEEPDEGQRL